MAAALSVAPGLTGRQAWGKEPDFKFKLGNDLPDAHPVNTRLREAIAAIGQETEGRVALELFPNNQLGSDTDMISQVRSGALEFATFPGTVLSTLVPVTSITGVGYAFTSYEKVWAAMDGDVGDYIRRAIGKVNLYCFDAVWDNGFRQTTSSTHPIETPVDFRNFKIRVPVVPLWVSMFSAFGAAPVSIPLSEAYSALQTRIADGQENPLSLISFAKFAEVQKYCSMTNHAWDGFWLLVNGRVWRGIPPDIQSVMQKHFNAAARSERSDLAQANVDTQRSLEKAGLAFNSTDPQLFQQALRKTNFYPQWREKFGPEAWNLVQKYAGDVG